MDKTLLQKILEVKKQMFDFADCVITGKWKGYTGKDITQVVNIGIGGSDLGPAMVTEALEFYSNQLRLTFVSNVEGDHVGELIKKIDPETTLFVIVSKSFTTQETISNAKTIRKWFLNHAPLSAISQHFVAVSTNLEKVTKFGIAAENIFQMYEWVGGGFHCGVQLGSLFV